MWQEIARNGLRVDKNSDVKFTSWENNMLVVLHNKGLYIFEFSCNLTFCKNLDFVMSFIPHSKASPVQGLYDTDGANLSNANMTEMVVDPAYWSNCQQFTQEMIHFVSSEWIPCGYLYHNEPAVATVNSVGNVEFYKPGRTGWTKVLDLSDIIRNKFIPNHVADDKDFATLKKYVNLLETSSVCVGANLGNDSCYFVTTQKGGNIYIWKINSMNDNLQAELVFQLNQEVEQVLTMKWVPISEHKFIIICCNIVGKIFSLHCKIDNPSNIILTSTSLIWAHKDRMVCTYLYYKIIDHKLILICNKNRHLVVLMTDFDGKVLKQILNNVSDYKITDIKERNEFFYLTVSNNKVYKVNITCNDELQIDLCPIEIKDLNPSLFMHSFGLSENSVIMAVCVYDNNVKYKGRPDIFKILYFCNDTSFGTEVDTLLENKTKNLSNVWDCIELIRYKVVKHKAMPSIDYNKLYEEGKEDIYKLKLYYILLIMYNIMVKAYKIRNKNLLPETSEEIVKGIISVVYAKKHLNELYDKYKAQNGLEDLEMQSLVATKYYLESYCKDNKRDLSEYVSNVVCNMIGSNVKYDCQCCDETLDGLTCSSGHLNMFCSLSFIPIEDIDYLVCNKCKATACLDLYKRKPRCIFCDDHLKYSYS